MRQRQPDMQRHEAGFRSGTEQREAKYKRGDRGGWRRGADRLERVAAVCASKRAECEQQRDRADARHHQIDVAGLDVVGIAMMRHHERAGGERHELPRHQEREGVIGEHNEVHAGKERRVERQHALRRFLVPAIAECEQARSRGNRD